MAVERFLNQVAAVLDPEVFLATFYHPEAGKCVHSEMLSKEFSR